jgi:hypothetical protein
VKEQEQSKSGHKRASKSRGLYTPQAKQTRVIAGALAGKSKSAIARTEGLKRDTVARILLQPEVEELVAAYRQQALALVPLCLAGLQAKLVDKNGKLRSNSDWRMMTEIMKGTQVLVGKQEQEVHGKQDEFDGRTRAELEFCLANGRFPDSTAGEQVPCEEAPPGTGSPEPVPK